MARPVFGSIPQKPDHPFTRLDIADNIDWYDDDYDFREPGTCPECDGEGIIIDCCDDLCVGGGHCIHGDGERICRTCHGEGEV